MDGTITYCPSVCSLLDKAAKQVYRLQKRYPECDVILDFNGHKIQVCKMKPKQIANKYFKLVPNKA